MEIDFYFGWHGLGYYLILSPYCVSDINMKLKKEINEEMNKLWLEYNASIDAFVDSNLEDQESWLKGIMAYKKIEALHWVLETTKKEVK